VIPHTIRFIAAYPASPSRILFDDKDASIDLDRWKQLRKSGIVVDFQRVLRYGSGLPDLTNFLIDLSAFNKVSNGIYRRVEDGLLIVVKSISVPDLTENCGIESEIENLINLHHPCISAPIGFVVSPQELKIARLYSERISLAEVLATRPAWWTAKAKAKAVAGLALGLRFAHSLGLLHDRFTASNILFDFENRIQIADFLCNFERRGIAWTPRSDVHAFVSILFEIVVGRPAIGKVTFLPDVAGFVAEIIEIGLSVRYKAKYSFNDIFETLEQNQFRIMAGVDPAEVFAFVKWVQLSDQSIE
jgi:hypothetical protein